MYSPIVYASTGTMQIECSAFMHQVGVESSNVIFSTDGRSVSVVYCVTIQGSDGEAYQESSGTVSLDDNQFEDPVQVAEAMAFQRACARFGLGLCLYHEDDVVALERKMQSAGMPSIV